jgi:hypothetical protein
MQITFLEPVKLDSLFRADDTGAEYSFTRLNHNDEYRARIEDGWLWLRTPYDEKLIARIKAPIFSYGKWEKETRSWGIYLTPINVREAVKLLTEFGFVFSESERDRLKELWR